MVMRNFLMMFSKVSKAKEIPSFTQFLVNNPLFRNLVLTFHENKTNAVKNID